ncbi:MAG: hypothetical protein BM563_01700 [Bacteroidetes bacterium MedPE-SWsnd-G1]|nr:MAG: hypothetical protein BM563_01700 [Bacteroidetes bacterium MedPE-SWsnd-G1]
MEFNIEIIGLLAAVLTTSSFVPQAFKIWNTKEVKDVSLTMYIAMFIGICLWFYYGVHIDSLSIILANLASGIIVLSILLFKVRYTKK